MSWREVEVLEAARSVTAARQGPLILDLLGVDPFPSS